MHNFENRKPRRFVNPADFVFIEILFRSANEGDAESKDLNLEYLNSHMASRTRALIDNPIFTERIMPQTLKDEPYFALQLGMLIKRATKNLWRDPLLLIIRTFITMILAVFIALVYLNVSSAQGQPVFLNISGAIFFVLINQLFISANSVLHVFITEKSVFLREYVAGYYGLPAYFLSKVIVEFPFQCIFPVLTSVIVYWIIGFRPGFDHFLLFTLFLIMASLNGSAIGFLSSTIVDSPDAAAVIGPLILLPFIIYGGFFVSNKNSPSWLAWIQWISPAQYAFTGMLLNELNGREINGLSGNAQLDLIGASSRFSVGVVPPPSHF
jgi:ABC-type multidrug transport system permease subunit